MKRIIVTPAGREATLTLLWLNLLRLRDEFDEWHLWLNTANEADLKFINRVHIPGKEVKIIYAVPEGEAYGVNTIQYFYPKACELDAVYVRLDDDIIYIHEQSLTNLFSTASDDSIFLACGNIYNNAIITHLMQRFDMISLYPSVSYNCVDKLGWGDGSFAELKHEYFLNTHTKNNLVNFSPSSLYLPSNWLLLNYERFSVNAISWTGEKINSIYSYIKDDEEKSLTVDIPRMLLTPNQIIGKTLFVHYAFYPQKAHLDKTDILKRYKEWLTTLL